ncbi:MAG: glycoside hydrolase family 13 protein [Lactobacillus sp.]|nr:glycoside hydrolase family 13 protein [Lactobacillus sp.]
MQIAALMHRPESEDSFITDVKHVHVRVRAAIDDVKKITAYYADNYFPLEKVEPVVLEKTGTGSAHDYYEGDLTAPYHRLKYTFVVEGVDGEKVILGDRGIRQYNETELRSDGNYFKIPYLHEVDMTKTPEWVRNTVWYQIFPERFANGDKSNDPVGTKPWNPTDHPGREDYYGGDLQGVLDHLDDLVDLGITGIYFCPLFTAGTNHKYDTIDYLAIDPDFGDKILFKKVVDEAHKRGIKIMIDAVFNHMGDLSWQWQDVVENGEKSRYADWFHIHQYPVDHYVDVLKDGGEPTYESFAFEKHMPKLNTSCKECSDYLLEVTTYWVKYFDIDAWRLDVANEVDHAFWKKFHDELVAIKPDFYIVGEVWHGAGPWLNGDQYTSVMNYPYTLQVEDHFFYKRTTAKELVARLTDQVMKYRDMTNKSMMNMLDSHDTARILSVAGGNQDLALQALTFQFLQQGSPCIYYGTEMGMDGDNDPDCRKPMDWSKKGGDVWQRVHNLVKFRLDHTQAIGDGKIRLEVVDDLIKVTRVGEKETVVGYFNTTGQDKPLNVDAKLSQNYEHGTIKADGFAIEVF